MSSRKSCALIAAALLGGCAHYSQEDGERLANEVYALNTQVQALQKSLSESQKVSQTHAEQLALLAKQVQTLNTAAFKNDADFGVQLDQALQEVARLRGLVEGSKERLDAIDSQLNKVSDLAEAQRKQTEASQEEQRARERVLQSAAQVIEEATRLINSQKPADARRLLREFGQRAEGDDKKKKDLDRVQFLLAETYFVEGSYQLAATEYNAVRKNFPKSSYVPEALFKMGLCFEKLKLPEDAKLFYKTVVDKHAKSDAAKRARERLKDLK